MKLTLLGCGTSGGVPRVGGPGGAGDWGECDPADPRNRRSRSSILIEAGGRTILVDSSPDLHGQLLANRVETIDAVAWTHEHADHCHGIDDLRAIRYLRGEAIPAYGSPPVLAEMRRRFAYIFEGSGGYPAICVARPLPAGGMIGNVRVSLVEQPHGSTVSTGFRFDHDGKSIVYAIDFSAITEAMIALYRDCSLLVVDCLRRRPHPTHAHLDMALELAQRARAGATVLSHMDSSLDYTALAERLPGGVEPGHDGLVKQLA